MTEVGRYVVARTSDIPEGERLIVDVAGRQVGIFHLDGEFHALLHRCPHLGGPLCLGSIVGIIESSGPGDLRFDPTRKYLTCPWHGWEFDIRTGQSYFDPDRVRARRYPVDIEHGEAIAGSQSGERQPGPYVAEVVPVAVEEDYVVLTMRR
jgi:nitrite reductase/ring-hydroxylating ferredoxin subunit